MEKFFKLEQVYDNIKAFLNSSDSVRISVIYACNTTGKTRLSRCFEEEYQEEGTLCYNAFLEDCFSWDNDNYTFNICNCWELKLINDEGLDKEIETNFQQFTNSSIEVDFNTKTGNIAFQIRNNEGKKVNIKISKGEESLFIWTIFYTILSHAIDLLSEEPEDRSTQIFDKLKYIVIDDPVSSMDDTRIITVGLAISELLEKAEASNKLKTKLGILITTHHTLFFNILHSRNNRKRKDYVLSRIDETYILKPQPKASPFAYHHEIIQEILNAIKEDKLKKYHFNLFRCLLEKTANFLGYQDNWSILIQDEKVRDLLAKTINHYSHNQLSETESPIVEQEDKELFENSFNGFIKNCKWNYNIK